MSPSTTHRLQLLGAALLFSTGGAAIKSTTLSSWQVAGFRSIIAALAIVLLVPAARRGWTWHVVPVGISYASTLILFVTANKLTTSANAIFLQSTAPLYMLALGPLLLRERVRGRDLAFMTPVALGMALFFVGAEAPAATAPDPARGNLLALLSGLTWALTLVGLRWMGNRAGGDGSAVPTVVAGNLIAFLACLPMALPVAHSTPGDWAAVGYLGVFQIGAAYLLLTAGIRHVPALEASVLLLLEPALNPVWAWLTQGETPGAWALAAGALILGATLLRTWSDARRDRANPGDQPVAVQRSVEG
ncbi:MAG TPA: EamA family transporter [Longimicrobium sp.]|uniref:DMT family transporter n=1 Tax=Longimicrobium sp. TaxID=2029185 RepID=UPI002ED95BB7